MVQDTIRIVLIAILLSLSCESKAAARQAAEPMQFELVGNGGNCADCEWISAEGVITAETPARFKAYLAREGDAPFRIHFNSTGGDLDAAIALGRLIRNRDHLITEVKRTQKSAEGDWYESTPGVCYDACMFAFLGGSQRIVDPKSRMGFSSAGTKAGAASQSQSSDARSGTKDRILSYLGDLNLSNQVLLKTLSATKPIPRDFERSDIVSWKIDNSSQAQGFTEWVISKAEGPTCACYQIRGSAEQCKAPLPVRNHIDCPKDLCKLHTDLPCGLRCRAIGKHQGFAGIDMDNCRRPGQAGRWRRSSHFLCRR